MTYVISFAIIIFLVLIIGIVIKNSHIIFWSAIGLCWQAIIIFLLATVFIFV